MFQYGFSIPVWQDTVVRDMFTLSSTVVTILEGSIF